MAQEKRAGRVGGESNVWSWSVDLPNQGSCRRVKMGLYACSVLYNRHIVPNWVYRLDVDKRSITLLIS